MFKSWFKTTILFESCAGSLFQIVEIDKAHILLPYSCNWSYFNISNSYLTNGQNQKERTRPREGSFQCTNKKVKVTWHWKTVSALKLENRPFKKALNASSVKRVMAHRLISWHRWTCTWTHGQTTIMMALPHLDLSAAAKKESSA